jgi:hypothetical protein
MIDLDKVKAKAEAATSAARQREADKTATIGDGKPWHKSWLILMEAVGPTLTDEQALKLRPKVDWAIKNFGVWDARLKMDPRRSVIEPGASSFYRDAEFERAVVALIVGFRQNYVMLSPTKRCHIGKKIERLLEDVGQYQPK